MKLKRTDNLFYKSAIKLAERFDGVKGIRYNYAGGWKFSEQGGGFSLDLRYPEGIKQTLTRGILNKLNYNINEMIKLTGEQGILRWQEDLSVNPV